LAAFSSESLPVLCSIAFLINKRVGERPPFNDGVLKKIYFILLGFSESRFQQNHINGEVVALLKRISIFISDP